MDVLCGTASVLVVLSQATTGTLMIYTCIVQRMHGSSSSLGASPKSSGSYWQSNGISSDAEEMRSSSSANGSMPHLEVRYRLVLSASLGTGVAHALVAIAAESLELSTRPVQIFWTQQGLCVSTALALKVLTCCCCCTES